MIDGTLCLCPSGNCPASGAALAIEKTIARTIRTARQLRINSQGVLRPGDTFTESRVTAEAARVARTFNLLPERQRGVVSH